MKPSTLKKRIANNTEVFGLFCSIPSAVALEQIAAAGYDFAIIDLEHTLIGKEQLEVLILAARASALELLVRVPPGALHLVVQLLDAGVAGIVFARIDDAMQAQQAVAACHYAPLGTRGLNSTRDSRYGLDGLVDYIEQAKQNTLVVVMIESRQGLANIDAIAATPGVDVILEGAADLSQSFELPWQTRHDSVSEAIAHIHRQTRIAGKVFCALPREPEEIKAWREESVSVFVVGDDRGIMRRAHQSHLAAYKE
ncbi:HpcH/HpaI aldolase family protein [Thalassomonas actiniarum]|uniref:Aldolase n=1 Tax=Thalassomonas actiniarum TaxID=485447 RepID=A0AAE9YRB6_9GAMM|nr:aldolase/citrate lyase family protein [Thalassomonas actiniarum]WDD99770.1 aldolase [Thalassomonas actiniarum]